MLMKVKSYVDFSYVEPRHQQIDQRLQNWGRASFSGVGCATNPMFRFVKPSQTWDEIETRIPVDRHDAMLIAKAVGVLPRPHMLALNWCYVKKSAPAQGQKMVGTTLEGLAQLIRDGRTMLINRKV